MTNDLQNSNLQPEDPQINRNILGQLGDEEIESVDLATSEETRESVDEEARIAQLTEQLEERFGAELRQRFDEYLDVNGGYEIAGAEFFPSQILVHLDSDLYAQALADFQKQEIEEAIEEVVQYYPTPIAYHFYRASNKDNNVTERFSALKDTWEAMIYLLFAIVMGEFRAHQHPLKISKKPTRQYLCDWKLHAKLTILQQLYDFAQRKSLNLLCMQIVSPDLLQRMEMLNRARNEYAHTASWSKDQTQQQLEKYLEEVVAILKMAYEFSDLTLLRYVEGTEVHTRPRFDEFVGRYLDHDRKVHDISKWKIHNHIALNDNNIIVVHHNEMYTISPWYHFIPADEGHSIRLCYFKQQDNTSKKMEYEIIGQARKTDFPETNFQPDLTEIDKLLVAGGKVT